MKTTWKIDLKTKNGQPCGSVEDTSIDAVVEQAKEEMPWCTDKHLRGICKKQKSERIEDDDND